MKKFYIILCVSYIAFFLHSKECVSNDIAFEVDGDHEEFLFLKSSEVNMRNGPAMSYPIKIKYKACNGYPMRVIAKFENLKFVEDVRGNKGWMHTKLLGRVKHAVIQNKDSKEGFVYAFRFPNSKIGRPIYKIKEGVILRLKKCSNEWCLLSNKKNEFWVQKRFLWGV